MHSVRWLSRHKYNLGTKTGLGNFVSENCNLISRILARKNKRGHVNFQTHDHDVQREGRIYSDDHRLRREPITFFFFT